MNIKTAFLSSPVKGLESCRDAAEAAINKLDGRKCVRMEDFGAGSDPPIDTCLRRLAACDLYVGILGHRYGSIHPGTGRSYTELEYEEACKRSIPRLMFLANVEFQISISEREPDELFGLQEAFRKRVSSETGHFVDQFADAAQLKASIAQAIANQVIKDINSLRENIEDETWLLLPFASNQAGFDTGIAVTNPDLTLLGYPSKNGACSVFYFGGYSIGQPIFVDQSQQVQTSSQTAGKLPPNGISVVVQRSGQVFPGGQLLFTLSGGGNLGIAATPGFQGYLLIRCEFPNARALAHLTLLPASSKQSGPGGGSMYIAEVIKRRLNT